MNLNKSRGQLILLLLILTPVFSIYEVFAFISGSLGNISSALTPIYIKIIKDLLIIFIICIGLVKSLRNNKIMFYYSYTFFILSCLIALIFSYNQTPVMILLAGIRWGLPFLLVPFIYDIVDEKLNYNIAIVLSLLLIFAFVLQLFELKFSSGWYGLNKFGLSKRNPGFFVVPLTMAAFSLFTHYFATSFLNKGIYRNIILFIIPISVLLTGSGTGILTYSTLVAVWVYRKIKQKELVFIFLIFALLGMIVMLPIISSRPNIYTSLFTRLSFYGKYITIENLFFSNQFGIGTNTGVLLGFLKNSDISGSLIVDSTFLSIILNIGVIGFIFFLYFIYYAFNNKLYNKLYNKIYFIIISVFFMITSILFELFPMNLLFSVTLVDFLHKRNEVKNQ